MPEPMSVLQPPAALLVRRVADSIAECLRVDADPPIDAGLARIQHASYVRALRDLGLVIWELGAAHNSPDCCFIEDCAVVLGQKAIVTRPGAPSRRGEVAAVATALKDFCHEVPMTQPATLDGGDVLRAGNHLFIGLSDRTNKGGADMLSRAARAEGIEVHMVPVTAGLHLKSAVTLVDAETAVYNPETLAPAALEALQGVGLSCLAAPEPAGANVLALGHAVLVSRASPETARMLRARGTAVVDVDVGELHKADGALTCLSLRIPQEGAWST